MKIAIDAGHGSNTAGKRSPALPFGLDINGDGIIDIKKGEQFREHVANVGVAIYLAAELERCGIQVFKTGFKDENPYDDEDTTLSKRQRAIAEANCDYIISVHFNAHGDGTSFTSAKGIGIYIHDKYANKSKDLANVVLEYLLKGTAQVNRGVTPNALAMCNCKSMDVKAAILLELAFMTNLEEVKLFGSKAFWKECAVEVAMGICEYTGIKYIKESSVPTKTITKGSPVEDIKWLQVKLNIFLDGHSFIPLKVDGIYGNKTRIAVLILWESIGWNKDGEDDGWRVGSKTINKLK